MNIYDISKLAGVSIATVSRVLNGNKKVSEKTKKKVLDIIEQQGYTPNVFARGLGLNTMKTIGLLCTDASDIYQAKAIYFIEELLRAQGYDSILCCSGFQLQGKEKCTALLLAKKVDALILIGSGFVYEDPDKDRYICDAAQQVPVMLLNAALDVPNVYGVVSDEQKSVFDATMQLIHSGIKDILYFYNSTSYSGKRKLLGYRQAMDSQGLLDEKRIHFFGRNPEDIPGMANYLLQLRKNGLDFHGIITSNDQLALAAIKYAKKAGLSIPQDLRIIGYDNSMLTCCSDPELTSIDVQMESLCQHLVVNLMTALKGENAPTITTLPGHIFYRETT